MVKRVYFPLTFILVMCLRCSGIAAKKHSQRKVIKIPVLENFDEIKNAVLDSNFAVLVFFTTDASSCDSCGPHQKIFTEAAQHMQ